MEKRLIDANLWTQADGSLEEQGYGAAWRVLARIGVPYRFSGKSCDGMFEYLVLHPRTGEVIATGRGDSSSVAMCEAALAAQQILPRLSGANVE
jgi:hypothetical protein